MPHYFDSSSASSVSMDSLKFIWASLVGVPLNDDGQITKPVMHFRAGVDHETIYKWFESVNPAFSVGAAMSGNLPETESQIVRDAISYGAQVNFDPIKSHFVITKITPWIHVTGSTLEEAAENFKEYLN